MDHTGTHTHRTTQDGNPVEPSCRGSLNWGLVARLGKMKDLL